LTRRRPLKARPIRNLLSVALIVLPQDRRERYRTLSHRRPKPADDVLNVGYPADDSEAARPDLMYRVHRNRETLMDANCPICFGDGTAQMPISGAPADVGP